MGLPYPYRSLPLAVKLNLASYRVCQDCRYGLQRLKEGEITYSAWKIEWAGICALLKTSIHLMHAKDAKSCLPEVLRTELRNAWNDLLNNKDKHPLFWEFIHRERNNIVKEYEFSAYQGIIKPDGTTRSPRGLLALMEEGEKEALLIKNGYYKDRQALEVLDEATQWVEDYILGAIIKAGYNPEEQRIAGSLAEITPIDIHARNNLLEDLPSA
jgi:hypothetical protein